MSRILALDIEGDGQTPSNPVQLGIREFDDFRLTPVIHQWFGRPPGSITKYASRVHNITDSAVAHLPPFESFLPEIMDVLGTDPIVGHGIRGDFLSIQRQLPDWRPTAAYDTLSLAKQLRPDLQSYKLTGVGRELGLIDATLALHPGGAHTAPFDATLAGLIAGALLEALSPEKRYRALDQSNIFRNKAQKDRRRRLSERSTATHEPEDNGPHLRGRP